MARSALYPPSVKPGIPKLGNKPKGWIETTFGDVLQVVQRPAEIEDEVEYQLVTARRARGGIVPREILLGKKILTKVQYYIAKDDFLISKRQIVHGACGVVPSNLHGALVSGEYSVLRVKSGLLLKYLDYFSHTDYFQMSCFQSSVGVDVEKMIFDLQEWLKVKIYLPLETEQKKIISTISSWDKAIVLTEQLIAAKQKQKAGFMQALFLGRKRFKEYSKRNERTKETTYGEIPTSWSIKKIHDIGEVNAITLKENGNSNKAFYYIDLSSVNLGEIDFPKHKIPFGELPSRARRVPRVGDVIMSTVRPNLLGHTVCDFDPSEYLCSTGFALISPTVVSDTQYIYQNLFGEVIQKQVKNLVTGSNYPAINSSDVSDLEIAFPNLSEERKKIGDFLLTIDKEVDLLNQKLSNLKVQKTGLVQKLLTGQIRVKV